MYLIIESLICGISFSLTTNYIINIVSKNYYIKFQNNIYIYKEYDQYF